MADTKNPDEQLTDAIETAPEIDGAVTKQDLAEEAKDPSRHVGDHVTEVPYGTE